MPAVHLYLLTFNCARRLHSPATLAPHLLSAHAPSSPPPSLILLSLQELAPLSPAFLSGPHLTPYLTPFTTAVRTATRQQFGEDYTLVTHHTIGLTALLLFARKPHAVKRCTLGGVGTGVWGMGNKGGVGIRLVYQEEEEEEEVKMTFVGVHLAPHEWNLQRRNADWTAIARGLVFSSSGEGEDGEGEEVGIYDPSSHLFVLGDFNYRTSSTRPTEHEYLVFPRPDDAPGDNTHFLSLFAQDQLRAVMAAGGEGEGGVFKGLVESEVRFAPTYRYARDGSWNRGRWPSWTDRVLFLPRGVREVGYGLLEGLTVSDHRAVVWRGVVEGGGGGVSGEVEEGWRERRAKARGLEVVVGGVAWLGTGMGVGVVVAVVVGVGIGWVLWRGLVGL